MSDTMRNGGQILVQQLRNQGVDRVFMVAGESYLPCIDALNEHKGHIDPVVCRQESGAAYMAEAHGKLTGTPGVCFVTRGPGAANAAVGVHTAWQDSTPMILFIGQVGQDMIEREAFQEVDYRRMFGQQTKWVAQIDQTERIPEFIARAFAVATNGRPGPVVLALPEDTLWGRAQTADLPAVRPVDIAVGPDDLQAMKTLLDGAKRPFLLLGGSRWTAQSMRHIEAFAERFELPVGTAWRRLECFDQAHPCAAGHVGWDMTPELQARIADADLLLAVGTRMGEATSLGYTLMQSPRPQQKLIHVYPDPEELGRVYQAELGIVATVNGFAQAVATLNPDHASSRADDVARMHQALQDSRKPLPFPGPLSLDEVAVATSGTLDDDACLTTGAGNYVLFPHRYREFRGPGTNLAATVGTMGYGLPAAIAAKLHRPDRTVVCFAGDGCFQMTMQELGVAMQYRLGIVILVFNNSMWGTIRAHQERDFPGREIALGFENPDYVTLVSAYGGFGEVVTHTDAFQPALDRALDFAAQQNLPALLELRYDPDGIAPGATLSSIRQQALDQ